MAGRVDYNGYVLTSDSQILPDKRWLPRVVIVRYEGSEARERLVDGAEPVETMVNADDLSIEIGRRWIDEHPDPFA